MARQYVMTSATAGTARDSLNSYLVGLFGDDPGDEIPVANACLDGADPTAATHSFGVLNTSQADCNSVLTFCGATGGCAANDAGPTTGHTYNWWALALSVFGLKPVQPVGP